MKHVFTLILILAIMSLSLSETSYAVDFVVDPKIENNGPILKLVTSDLPKEKLVALKNGQINWERPGIRIEQLRMVAEKVGVRFAYARVPWLRAIKFTQDGTSDGVFVTGYTAERTEWGAYPFLNGNINTDQAVSKVVYWFYVRRGTEDIWDGENLTTSPIVIGGGVGDYMSKKLRDEGHNVIEVGSYEQLALMLEKGRINAALGFRTLVDDIISENPSTYPNVVKLEIPLRKLDGYLVFSVKVYGEKQKIIDHIWRAIGELWADGTMNRLFLKYENTE